MIEVIHFAFFMPRTNNVVTSQDVNFNETKSLKNSQPNKDKVKHVGNDMPDVDYELRQNVIASHNFEGQTENEYNYTTKDQEVPADISSDDKVVLNEDEKQIVTCTPDIRRSSRSSDGILPLRYQCHSACLGTDSILKTDRRDVPMSYETAMNDVNESKWKTDMNAEMK